MHAEYEEGYLSKLADENFDFLLQKDLKEDELET